MKRKLLLRSLLISLFTLFTVNIALANPNNSPADQPLNRHQGFYASANIGIGAGVGRDDYTGETFGSLDGIGGSIFAGYNFNPYLGVEVGVAPMSIVGVTAVIYHAALVGTFPLGDRFMWFGKLGGAVFHLSTTILGQHFSVTNGSFFAGSGIGVAINRQIALTLQYNAVFNNTPYSGDAIGLLSIGANWYFNS